MSRFLILLFALLSFSSYGALSPRTYNALTELQGQIDQGPDVAAATSIEAQLLKLEQSLKGNDLGLALTWQTLAQLHIQQQKEQKAISLLKQAVALKNLNLDTKNQISSLLAFLYYSQSQYQDAVVVLKSIIASSKDEAGANIYALLAASLYSLEDFRQGLPYIEKACAKTEQVKEPWLQMAFSGHYQLGNMSRALNYLNQLLFHFPEKADYWHQKAGLHQMLEQYHDASITKDLAYQKGLLKTESHLVNLTQLLASQGNPYKVATALQAAMDSQQIQVNEKVLRLQYQAWLQAKEIKTSLAVLKHLVEAYKKPNDAVQLLSYELDAENWKLALQVSELALALELSKKQQGKVLLMKGIANYRLGNEKRALIDLGKASAFQESSSQAKSWMSYIQQMRS